MQNDLNKVPTAITKIIRFLFISLILVLFSAAFVIGAFGISHKTLNTDELADLNQLTQEKIENGLPIKGKIDLVLDTFAEEYETTDDVRSSEKSTKLYYIVPVYNTDDQGAIIFNYLLVYECEPKNFDKMGSILMQTYTDTEELTELNIESGIIKDLTYDVVGFYNGWQNDKSFYENGSFIDWCVENNIFGTNDVNVIKGKILPYMITDSSGSMDIAWVLLPIAGVIFVVLMILIIINKRVNPVKPNADNDYISPPDINKTDNHQDVWP